MRSAPSVMYPVGRCAFQGRLLLALGAVGALAWGLSWMLSGTHSGGVSGLGAVAWLLWSVLALRSWRRAPVGHLQWNARSSGDPVAPDMGGWHWHAADGSVQVLGAVQWVLDGQSVILLRLQGEKDTRRWAWLEGAADPAHWDSLRRALKAHAR